jgi:hypothetical protein
MVTDGVESVRVFDMWYEGEDDGGLAGFSATIHRREGPKG